MMMMMMMMMIIIIIIMLPVLRQVHGLFQSECSTECDLVLRLSISSILSFHGQLPEKSRMHVGEKMHGLNYMAI